MSTLPPSVTTAEASAPVTVPPAPGWALPTLALTYGLMAWAAQQLIMLPGHASPLYPAAGVALVAVLVWGAGMLPAIGVGAFVASLLNGPAHDPTSAGAWVLPAVLAMGAMLQAQIGALLVRRAVRRPMTLDSPGAVLRFFAFGALLGCTVGASWGTGALVAMRAVPVADAAATWWTWWVGDALGVLIVAPALLTLIGRPRDAWAPRRLTVGLPLLLAALLLSLAMLQVGRWSEERALVAFERDAGNAANTVALRLGRNLDALDALHSLYVGSDDVDVEEFRLATATWLARLPSLYAMGWHERVPRSELAAFEQRVRGIDLPDYHVFERDATLAAGDDELLVMRHIEPRGPNARALGVNVLSIPAARDALLRARGSGEPAATASFRLTQETGDQNGVVIYRAVPPRHGAAAAPPRGMVFVTLRMQQALDALASGLPTHLALCLIDRSVDAQPQRLAGVLGCEQDRPDGPVHRQLLPFAGRTWEVQVSAPDGLALGTGLSRDSGTGWLFSIAGLLAGAMLGALLLIVTGRARRTEAAVAERTRQLRLEVQERQSTEQALSESEQRFRGILASVPVGVVYADLDGRIRQPNPAFCVLTGYSEAELLRMTVVELTDPEDREADRIALEQLMQGVVAVHRRRKHYVLRDGRSLPVRASVSLLRNEAGEPHRMVGVVEDISELLRLEESERARETAEAASRTKSDFLSRMSHELRTPLNAMLGFAQLLELDRHAPLADRHRQWVGQIQQAGWHLLEMINDVLDLSRIEADTLKLQPKPVALEPLIAESMAMVEPQARQAKVVVMRNLSDHPPLRVMGDATRVKQILSNLLSNAVKYNRSGGKVEVSTRSVCRADGVEMLELDVTDTGLGMDAQQLEHLFQPFNRLGRERGAAEGTGIGLVISRLLAERHGGALRVVSRAGVGSTFTLVLPLASAAMNAPVTAASAFDGLEPEYHRRRVLYIEDNDTNVEVMRGVFALRPQVELTIASTGLDGLAAVRTTAPDLVLLDMHLPDIDGMALLQHLQADASTAEIAVVVVSADALPSQRDAALAAGATRYVTKPVQVNEVLSVIDDLLSQTVTRFG